MNRQPLTVAVVGATGVVGRTMIQILNEREFPVGELRLLASGRSAGRTVSIDGRTLEIGEAVPDAFEGVDIALFSAGADISLDLAPAAVARGRDRHRQLVGVADGYGHPAGRVAGQSGRPRGPPGHHRQPELFDDAAGARPDGAARHRRHRAGRRRHVPVRLRDGRRRARGARGPDPRTRLRRGADRHRLPASDRLQRAPRDRRLPPERLHQGGVEARQREPQDPAPAGPAHLVHGRPHPGLRQPLGGRPRRDPRAD